MATKPNSDSQSNRNHASLTDWLILAVPIALLVPIWCLSASLLSVSHEIRWYWLRNLTIELALIFVGTVFIAVPKRIFNWFTRLSYEVDEYFARRLPTWGGFLFVLGSGIIFLGCGALLATRTLTTIFQRPECFALPCLLNELR